MSRDRLVTFWTVVAGIAAVVAVAYTVADHWPKSPLQEGGRATTPSVDPSTVKPTVPRPAPTTTSRPRITTYLADLEPVDGITDTEPKPANGNTYAHTVTSNPECDDPSATDTISYNLGRRYNRLLGTVAEADDSRSVTRYQVQIVGDGRILYTQRIVFGKSYKINVDIARVLRLDLRTTLLSGSGAECYFQGTAVYGDIRAIS
jgi:hypothetical protein